MSKTGFGIVLLLAVILLSSLLVSAQMKAWGSNTNGQLGIGNLDYQTSPIVAPFSTDITGISGGTFHTLYLTSGGRVLASGANNYAQLGIDYSPSSQAIPQLIPSLSDVVQVAADSYRSMALKSNGTVWAWGWNRYGEIGDGSSNPNGCECNAIPTQSAISNVVQISSGTQFSLALKSDGTVWAWGDNRSGQIGDGTTGTARFLPTQVGVGVPGFNNIIAISAGADHGVALKSDGTVWLWGSNRYGVLGNGTVANSGCYCNPAPQKNPTMTNVKQIAAGSFHTMALKTDETLWVWGMNYYGEVGDGTWDHNPQSCLCVPTPRQTTIPAEIVIINTHNDHNIVRMRDGSIRLWGANSHGQMGDGTFTNTGCFCRSMPFQTPVGNGIVIISTGAFHSHSAIPTFRTPTGENVRQYGESVSLTFANALIAGNTSYASIDPTATGLNVPPGYKIQANAPAYNVTSAVTSSGNIDVCMEVPTEYSPARFASLKILHEEGSNLVDRTFSSTFIERQICARVSSLSRFVVARVASSPFDFDGDSKTDISIFRPSNGQWWLNRSTAGIYAATFGNGTDKIVPADYTGDGKTDIAFWRPSTGEWFVLRSEDGSYFAHPFGAAGDIPAPGDFDADGEADQAVFRPSTATWYVLRSSGGTTIQQFGANGDAPVVADYDGDGKSDIGIWRAPIGEWWIQRSSNNSVIAFQFGNSADKPVMGDYTGDGKADAAFYRPSSGEWFVLRSENQSYYSFAFGTSGDIPAPGDYDGDGVFDAAVFRPAGGTWYVKRSTAGVLIQNFGASGDKPVPGAFVP